MLGGFLIFLREGLECSMIISIMCAYLNAAGRRDLFRPVFAGVAAAIVLAAAVGGVLYAIARDAFIDSAEQAWFETGTFVLAVIVLTYMTFWMKRNSRTISSSLKREMAASIDGGSAAPLFLLALVTVGREALEASIFTLAIIFSTSTQAVLLGGVVGLVVAVAASIAMYRVGIRLNLKYFFAVVGSALLVVAAGMLANAVQNLQELGVIPFWTHPIWNLGAVLSSDSTLGHVLHGIIGYDATPSTLQFAAWIIFLAIGLLAFLGRPSRLLLAKRA